jgi:hypothetical protein
VKLHRAERDYYVIEVTTDPPLSGTWEASFDNGETWVDGTSSSGEWSWLVYGPDFVPADVGMTADGTEIATSVTPILRLKDDPVLDIAMNVPSIQLWGTAAAE